MPRKGPAPRRDLAPDPIYKSVLVTQIINKILERGKRTIAERIVYGALETVEKKTSADPVATLKRALEQVRPELEVKSRRVGGATYQVPVEVRPDRRVALGMRWLINYAAERGEKTMREKLAAEMMDAANNRGGAVKKKDDTHKMAEANKAFAHYRW
jgi:small subunit ribosomal protein S7